MKIVAQLMDVMGQRVICFPVIMEKKTTELSYKHANKANYKGWHLPDDILLIHFHETKSLNFYSNISLLVRVQLAMTT